jgi:hypothetical protein
MRLLAEGEVTEFEAAERGLGTSAVGRIRGGRDRRSRL